jgi:hypothetical protein
MRCFGRRMARVARYRPGTRARRAPGSPRDHAAHCAARGRRQPVQARSRCRRRPTTRPAFLTRALSPSAARELSCGILTTAIRPRPNCNRVTTAPSSPLRLRPRRSRFTTSMSPSPENRTTPIRSPTTTSIRPATARIEHRVERAERVVAVASTVSLADRLRLQPLQRAVGW